MIRILQFADLINRHDFIDNIVHYADHSRFQVGVCVRSPWNNIAAPVYTNGTPHCVLGCASRQETAQAAWKLAGLLRRWKADILHTHHYDQAVIGWLATRLCPRTRLVVGRHYSDSIYRSSNGVKRRALLALERIVNQSAARIVVPSRAIIEIVGNRQGVPAEKIDCVPYGFVAQKYAAFANGKPSDVRQELGLDGRLVLGNFARLHEEKGQRYLLTALALLRPKLPDLSLLLVGEGPEREALERQANELGLDQAVHFLGWRRDAMAIMSAVDVVVQPTLQEAFSQVMAEALWLGKPLIMSNVSGAADVIQDGVNGLLVPPADVTALTQAIERMAGDADFRGRLGEAGHAYVEENLTIEKVIPQYEQVYLRAMQAS